MSSMMPEAPEISIVIPADHAEALIAGAVRSVLETIRGAPAGRNHGLDTARVPLWFSSTPMISLRVVC